MEERSLFHRMRQIFREEGETEEVGSQAMKLIRNIVRYLDKDAKDIMTHRRDIVGIDERKHWKLHSSLCWENVFPDSRYIGRILMRL